ncbi:DUF6168 family protein [Namhaeicola litoreus]|uniref:DUF6168 family protein n=1 Tax=Namhaeicola litoreus TaxID=1052145 RepID=A0ABW3XWP3_9FLAO
MAQVLRFSFVLCISLFFVFFVHTSIIFQLDLPIFDHLIVAAYLINCILAILIYTYLFYSRRKYHDQLGFLFMFGSMLKFAVFFIFFYPSYKADNQLETIEFITFFIPYVICLILETLGLIKILKN